jgi:protein-tyrosine phosphatase
MLESSTDQLRTAFTLVAKQSKNPLGYHCTAGKDRTGVLTMLILGCLGVSRHDIATGYALTSETLEESRAVLQTMYPEIAQVGNDWGHQYMMASYDTMDRLVGDVITQHGSITDATRSLGVTTEAIDLLQNNLIA